MKIRIFSLFIATVLIGGCGDGKKENRNKKGSTIIYSELGIID
jgi:hypothetical protein